jgi:hypothetical protein
MKETITTGLEKSLELFQNKIDKIGQSYFTARKSLINFQLIIEALNLQKHDLNFTAILQLSEECDINAVIDNHQTKRRLDLDFKGDLVSITLLSNKKTQVTEYTGITPYNIPELQTFTIWITE